MWSSEVQQLDSELAKQLGARVEADVDMVQALPIVLGVIGGLFGAGRLFIYLFFQVVSCNGV